MSSRNCYSPTEPQTQNRSDSSAGMQNSIHKPFRLTWNFAVLSGVVITAAATLLTVMYHRMAVGDLASMAERNNVALARVLANSIWTSFSGFVSEARSVDPGALRFDPRVAELHELVSAHLEGLSVVKVKIYDLDGLTVFSTDRAQIGEDKRNNAGFVSARSGDVASQLAHRDTFDAFEGSISDRDLLSSYIPIRAQGPDAAVEGVFEIYYDVTEFLAEVQRTKTLLAVIVVSTLALIYAFLVVFVKRGDGIIKRQLQKNIELATSAARAEAASQAKTEFLTNMSHELRTPLNAIIGFSEIMKGEMFGSAGTPKYKEYSEDIHASAVHLLGVINDIFDLTKAEAGKIKVDIRPIDVGRAVAAAVQMVRNQSEAGGVRLMNCVGDRLGQFPTDERKFKQAMVNVLSNAIKFTPAGGSVTVRGFEDATNGAMVFEVVDTGIGMTADDIRVALTPFGQVDSSLGRRFEGTGLGLPLTEAFVELLGGALTIQSRPGAGTTVRIALPSAPASTAPRDARVA